MNKNDECAKCECVKLVKALLGAPPPRTWRKWPYLYQKATEFVKSHTAECDN